MRSTRSSWSAPMRRPARSSSGRFKRKLNCAKTASSIAFQSHSSEAVSASAWVAIRSSAMPSASSSTSSFSSSRERRSRRRDLLSRDELKDDVLELAEGIAEDLIATHADAETASEEWDWKAIDDAVFAQFNFRLNLPEEERAGLRIGALQELLVERIRKAYEQRETTFSAPIMRHLEKLIMLQTLDALWKDHLLNMDHLKEGIGLRGYGQVNPLQAYQKEGYDMFEDMIRRMEADVIEKLMSVQLRTEAAGARPVLRVEGMEDEQEALPAELEAMQRRQRQTARVTLSHGGPAAPEKIETVRRDAEKVGRNDPCPCGSGKKYKKCHGRA